MRKLLAGTLGISLFLLGACSNSNESLVQRDIEHVEKVMTAEEDDYLLIVKEEDGEFEEFVEFVKEVANEESQQVTLYNTFQPDGEELVDRGNFEYTDELKGAVLYSIQDGNVTDEINVGMLTADNYEQQLVDFFTRTQ